MRHGPGAATAASGGRLLNRIADYHELAVRAIRHAEAKLEVPRLAWLLDRSNGRYQVDRSPLPQSSAALIHLRM
jgi:hypothetical protein